MFNRLREWNERQQTAIEERQTGRAELKAWMKDHRREQIASFQGVHLFPDRIVRLPGMFTTDDSEWGSHDIAGVTASVETGGGVAARATLTRTAVPGAHGWQKKIDTRECWLTVDGADFQWVIEVPATPKMLTGQARKFAATVTSAGRVTDR